MKLYKKLLKRIEDGNPIYCNETFAKDLEAIANKHFEQLAIQRVVNWLPLESKHYELFTKLAKENRLLKKFDDGTILKDGEDEPFAICTHFAEEI